MVQIRMNCDVTNNRDEQLPFTCYRYTTLTRSSVLLQSAHSQNTTMEMPHIGLQLTMNNEDRGRITRAVSVRTSISHTSTQWNPEIQSRIMASADSVDCELTLLSEYTIHIYLAWHGQLPVSLCLCLPGVVSKVRKQ